MRLKKKSDPSKASAARFRENLEATTDRPSDTGEQFDRFRDFTRKLVQVPKSELDKRRTGAQARPVSSA